MSKNIPQAQLKKNAALHALSFITEEISYLGLGTGSTVNCLLEYLAQPEYKKILKNISAIVSSSDQTTALIKKLNLNIPIENLNNIGTVDLYLDGADGSIRLINLSKAAAAH